MLAATAARIADSVNSTGFYLGLAAGLPVNMKLAEIIVYNRALTDAELIRLERWLAARYSL